MGVRDDTMPPNAGIAIEFEAVALLTLLSWPKPISTNPLKRAGPTSSAER